MLIKIVKNLYNFGVKYTPKILPYISSLFYLEIMYLTFIVFLLFGRGIAIVFIFVLVGLYSIQIINLSKRSNTARKIQLLIFDLHLATGIVFIICAIFLPDLLKGHNVWYFWFRIVCVGVEVPLLYFLMLGDVVEGYFDKG